MRTHRKPWPAGQTVNCPRCGWNGEITEPEDLDDNGVQIKDGTVRVSCPWCHNYIPVHHPSWTVEDALPPTDPPTVQEIATQDTAAPVEGPEPPADPADGPKKKGK